MGATRMSSYPDREGSWEPKNDILKNPGGFMLEVFFAKRDPSGRPLSKEELTDLGSSLIGAMEDNQEFRAKFIDVPIEE
jgi:hypothetical protein